MNSPTSKRKQRKRYKSVDAMVNDISDKKFYKKWKQRKKVVLGEGYPLRALKYTKSSPDSEFVWIGLTIGSPFFGEQVIIPEISMNKKIRLIAEIIE